MSAGIITVQIAGLAGGDLTMAGVAEATVVINESENSDSIATFLFSGGKYSLRRQAGKRSQGFGSRSGFG